MAEQELKQAIICNLDHTIALSQIPSLMDKYKIFIDAYAIDDFKSMIEFYHQHASSVPPIVQTTQLAKTIEELFQLQTTSQDPNMLTKYNEVVRSTIS
jgi:hypothetical protein